MAERPPAPSTVPSAEALFRETGGPDFAEPWQAQAFACALQLSRQGLFTWTEWVELFSAEIAVHPQTHNETADAAYYRQWLAALETIVGLKGAASSAEINERQEAWREAYLKTPHGQPVELGNAVRAPAAKVYHHIDDHSDHQHSAPKPVAVSPAASY
jgi:nitrile hydratase accessory protein